MTTFCLTVVKPLRHSHSGVAAMADLPRIDQFDSMGRRNANYQRILNDQIRLGESALVVADDVQHLDRGGSDQPKLNANLICWYRRQFRG